MSGFANMGSKDVVLAFNRMSWADFAKLLDSLAVLLVRGEIPLDQRPEYQDHAATLHAAAKSVVFTGQHYDEIKARIIAEVEAYQLQESKDEQHSASNAN